MIRHILSDGTVLESIEGLIVPPTGKTEAVYRLMAGFLASQKPSTEEKPQKGRE